MIRLIALDLDGTLALENHPISRATGNALKELPDAAGHVVAMANGHQDLQAAADMVCGHNRKDGIPDAVNYIRERNGRR